MEPLLKDRNKNILHAVIKAYLEKPGPVGSKTISRKYILDLSPATIRNTLSELEAEGFLWQPHISAGRLPTEQAMRYYVDSILEVEPIPMPTIRTISEGLSETSRETDRLMKKSSKILSSVTQHIGLALSPRFLNLELKQIEFVELNSNLVLSILVSSTGTVQNRIIEVEEAVTQEELDRFNRYLNETFAGLTIEEIKEQMEWELEAKEKISYNIPFRALALGQLVIDELLSTDELYIEGQGRLLDYPEFSDDYRAMQSALETFEEKKILIDLLNKVIDAHGIKIFIGSETELVDMEGWTVIASSYSRGATPIGTIGILGPTRLDYSKIIPMVEYTARILSHTLERIN